MQWCKDLITDSVMKMDGSVEWSILCPYRGIQQDPDIRSYMDNE